MSVPRPGDLLARRYRLLEPWGETALWVAFLARDEQHDSGADGEASLLVKIVRPELAHDEPSRAYVLRELTRARILQHPGVIRPAEILVPDERTGVVLVDPLQPGMSQELLLGRRVALRRAQGERFALEEVRRIGAQLASALSYIHGQLLCHGDLRLESLLLRPEGVKLWDVGLGRALPRGPYLDAVQKAGEAHLLAPEVLTGRPPDARSDVYSLGALYRHLLTLGDEAAWESFQQDRPALASILGRALEPDPQQRFPSVEGLVADVEAVALTGAPVRRRHSPTPVALAVAAGRLPVEELSRPPQKPGHGSDKNAVVLAPLASSASAPISVPPRAPQPSSPPRALQEDDRHQPARPVRRADKEVQSQQPVRDEPSDIGAHHTIPVGRLDEAAVAPSPPRAPPTPEGAEILDSTIEHSRLDPEDLPTTAVPRLAPEETTADAQPTLRAPPPEDLVSEASLNEHTTKEAAPVLAFRELPPLLPLAHERSQRPGTSQADEEAATGLYTPPPRSQRDAAADSWPGSRPPAEAEARPGTRPPLAEAARPTPEGPTRKVGEGLTRPSRIPAPAAAAPAQRMAARQQRRVVIAAFLIATLVGVLGATLVVTLLKGPPVRQAVAPPRAPVSRPASRSDAVPPPAPAAPLPAPSRPAPVAQAPAATARCPEGMVAVAGPSPFCIDRYEQPGAGQRPLAGLSHKEAEAHCQKLGRRLCTDAEWELACRGKGRASYPYGHDVRETICNTRGGVLLPAGARPGCTSAVGAFDMSGNVSEWTQAGSLRGGSAHGETDGRCSVRLRVPPTGRSPLSGVRCCA